MLLKQMDLQPFLCRYGNTTRLVYVIYDTIFDALYLEEIDPGSNPTQFIAIEGVSSARYGVKPYVIGETNHPGKVVYPVGDHLLLSDGTTYILEGEIEDIAPIQTVSAVLPLKALEGDHVSIDKIREMAENPVYPSSLVPMGCHRSYLARTYEIYPIDIPDSVVSKGERLPVHEYDSTADILEVDPLIQPFFGSIRSGNRGVTARDSEGNKFVMLCSLVIDEKGNPVIDENGKLVYSDYLR